MPAETKKPIEEQLEAWAQHRGATTGGPFTMHPATRKMLLDEAHRQHPKESMSQLKTEPNDAMPSPLAKWMRRLAVGTTAAFVMIILAVVYLPGQKQDAWQFAQAANPSAVHTETVEPQEAKMSGETRRAVIPGSTDSNITLAGLTTKDPAPGSGGDRYGRDGLAQNAMPTGNAASTSEVSTLDSVERKSATFAYSVPAPNTKGLLALEVSPSPTPTPMKSEAISKTSAEADSLKAVAQADNQALKMEMTKSTDSAAWVRGGKLQPSITPAAGSKEVSTDVALVPKPQPNLTVALSPASTFAMKPDESKNESSKAIPPPAAPAAAAARQGGIAESVSVAKSMSAASPKGSAMSEPSVGAKAKLSELKGQRSEVTKKSPVATSAAAKPEAPMPKGELVALEKLQIRQQFSQLESRSQLRRNFNSPATPTVLDTFHVENQGRTLRIVDADGSVYTGVLGESPADRFAAARSAATTGVPFRVTGASRTLEQQIVFDGNLAVPAADANAAQVRGRVTIGGRVQMEVNATASPR